MSTHSNVKSDEKSMRKPNEESSIRVTVTSRQENMLQQLETNRDEKHIRCIYTDWQSLSEQQKRIERISPKTRPYRVNCPIAHTEYTESKRVQTDLQSLIEKQWANGMRDIRATSRVHESIYYQGELVRNSLPQMISTFGSRINPTIWYSMCAWQWGATRMQWSYSTCNTQWKAVDEPSSYEIGLIIQFNRIATVQWSDN